MRCLSRFIAVVCLSFLMWLPAAAQRVQCNPCNHGYGQVQIGTTKQFSFKLTNSGRTTVHLLSKSKTGKGFLFGSFPLPLTLKPGKTTLLPVKFRPKGVGRVTGTVTIESDAKNQTLSMSVAGTGVEGATLGSTPASLDFGHVTVGSKAKLPLKFTAANGPVTISSLDLSSPEFRVRGANLPLNIASGQSATITVVFAPAAAGAASAKLTTASDATNSPLTVPLSGRGVAASEHRADLSWNASPDPVIGYNVYRGTTHRGPYSQINSVLEASTNYTDKSVSPGATYFYVVTAMDSSDRESRYSNEVEVVIPNP